MVNRLTTFIFLLLSVSLLFTSCQSKTPEGYSYDVIVDNGQAKLKMGDEALVYFEIRTKDTILFTTPSEEGIPVVLTNPALNKTKKTGPIADVLPLLGEGDSAVVRLSVTEDMRVAQGLENADEIFYHLAVRKVSRSGSEPFGKSNVQPSSGTKDIANIPNLRAALKAKGKGLEELRILGQFIGQVTAKNTELKKTETGLVYRILEEGTGEPLKAGMQVSLSYLGSLAKGTVFGETYDNDIPFEFTYQEGRVIKGWDEGLGLVRRGGTLLLAVPPELAYGKLGKAPYIEPNETLYYYLVLGN